jgi:hypothetical protein
LQVDLHPGANGGLMTTTVWIVVLFAAGLVPLIRLLRQWW